MPPDFSSLLITPLEAFQITWKARFRIAVVFCTLLMLCVLGIANSPVTYISEAKLFVRIGRESIGLDPLVAAGGNTLALSESRETELNSVMEMMQSRGMMELMVDKLTPEVVLGRHEVSDTGEVDKEQSLTQKLTNLLKAIPRPRLSPPISIREEALEYLDKNMSISLPKKSTVISIAAKAKTPQLAQKLTQAQLEIFLDEHIRLNRTEGSYSFLRDQSESAQRELTRLQDELRDAKNAVGVISLEGSRKVLQDQMTAAYASLAKASGDRAAAKAAVEALEREVSTTSETLVTQRVEGFPNDGADRSRQRLNDMLVEEGRLMSRYTSRHPRVVSLRNQIAQARRSLKEEEPTTQTVQGVNPLWQPLVSRLVDERAKLEAAISTEKLSHEKLVEVQEMNRDLNNAEGKIELLTKEVETAQKNYQELDKLKSSARLEEDRESQRLTNVNIAQQPTRPGKPTGPSRSLMLALAMFVAAGIAVVCPVGTVMGLRLWRCLNR